MKSTRNQFIFQIKKDKIDVILAHYGMIGAEVVSVCKELELPLVVHFHGHDAVRYSIIESYRNKYLEMFSYDRLAIISVSPVMTEKLIGLGCPIEKIIYNPCGPNDTFLDLEPEFTQLQCIAIGRFVPKKAPQNTIKAFALALKEYPKATLVMAGDGELLEACKKLVISLGIEKQVTFPGWVSVNEFQSYLKTSRVFLQHSVTAADGDMEGTPVAILEAQAAGLPVIATYHAGIPDVVMHNKTGYLVNEHNVSLMGSYIKDLLRDKAKAKLMGVHAKERIKERFTIKRYFETLQEVLESIRSNN